MTYRPGAGTAALLSTAFAVAVMTAVLASFLLFPGSGCNADGCGSADDPQVGAMGDQSPSSPPAPPPASTAPAAPTDDPFGTPGTPGGPSGGTPTDAGDLRFDTQVAGPAAATGSGGDPAGISAMLLPGPLRVVTPAPGGSGYLKVNSVTGNAEGRIAPVLVQDFRGSRSGWTLTATMSDFSAAGGSKLDADKLNWVPKCGAHPGPSSYPSTPVAGSPVATNRTALLCSTPSLPSVTGGQFDVEADLRLQLPDRGSGGGTYTATLVLTLA
ncbi:hypothetical protein GCM10023205_30390 [Yinghuangia aomiensis]|uniref:WxL domain surface cell wall-binding n=1 Tax=Yinghuangia aomiensis TaxID=676205 RepID=A0ABP9H8V7_9ACTN